MVYNLWKCAYTSHTPQGMYVCYIPVWMKQNPVIRAVGVGELGCSPVVEHLSRWRTGMLLSCGAPA